MTDTQFLICAVSLALLVAGLGIVAWAPNKVHKEENPDWWKQGGL